MKMGTNRATDIAMNPPIVTDSVMLLKIGHRFPRNMKVKGLIREKIANNAKKAALS